MYVIEIRQAGESTTGLISKSGSVMKFNSDQEAREWGRENIEGSRRIASWVPITEEIAKQKGHEI